MMNWKTVPAFLGAAAGFLFGELDGLMVALIAFICLDYVTGLVVGAVQHKLNSHTGFVGLVKKALILVIVAIAHIVDQQILGGENSVFRSAACCLYSANEGLSILENCGKLGVPYPKKLKQILEQLREKDDKKGD